MASDMLQVLAFAVLGILLFSPLSWRMAYVWAIVPMALVLSAPPKQGTRLQYTLVACGTVLTCLPVWDHAVLDSLETIGAVLAGAGLLALLLRGASRADDDVVLAPGEEAQRMLSTQSD
ncbi:MAG: hypothetical protein GX624_08345 [Actinobacteria bacterium]|nr:hypothetical protein [Actinomycetota bacterium]